MKNRTAIGIVCIILAVAITFVVSPMVNKVSDKKTETVRFTTNVTHGTKIKETDVEVVKISNSALPDKVVKNKITINSFAGGLSGKLQNGDVVSICVTGKDNKTEIPAELKYVKVITTTTSGGIDENDVVDNEDGSFDLPTTITVLVSVEQARILEKNAAMHIVLVYRGDDTSAEKFLKAQDAYLEKNSRNGG